MKQLSFKLDDLFLYYKRIDIFSFMLGFEYQETKRKKNIVGASLTLIVIIISIIISFLYGKDIYQRKLPNVSLTDEFLKDSNFTMNDFTVFFLVSDSLGNILEEPFKYVYPHAQYLSRINSVTQFGGEKYNNFTRCERRHFSNIERHLSSSEIEVYLALPTICVDYHDDALILNSYGYTNSSYINYAFEFCNSSLHENLTCGENLSDYFQELYIRFYFINSYADSLDYKHPVKYYLDVINQQITNTYLKRNFIRFINNKFIADDGWLLENNKITHHISLKSVKLEINNISQTFPYDRYWISIESPQIRENRLRNYVKLQDLLGKIGGFVSGFIIIINILFYHYFRFKYLVGINETNNSINSNINEKSFSFLLSRDNKQSDVDGKDDNTKNISKHNCSNNRSINKIKRLKFTDYYNYIDFINSYPNRPNNLKFILDESNYSNNKKKLNNNKEDYDMNEVNNHSNSQQFNLLINNNNTLNKTCIEKLDDEINDKYSFTNTNNIKINNNKDILNNLNSVYYKSSNEEKLNNEFINFANNNDIITNSNRILKNNTYNYKVVIENNDNTRESKYETEINDEEIGLPSPIPISNNRSNYNFNNNMMIRSNANKSINCKSISNSKAFNEFSKYNQNSESAANNSKGNTSQFDHSKTIKLTDQLYISTHKNNISNESNTIVNKQVSILDTNDYKKNISIDNNDYSINNNADNMFRISSKNIENINNFISNSNNSSLSKKNINSNDKKNSICKTNNRITDNTDQVETQEDVKLQTNSNFMNLANKTDINTKIRNNNLLNSKSKSNDFSYLKSKILVNDVVQVKIKKIKNENKDYIISKQNNTLTNNSSVSYFYYIKSILCCEYKKKTIIKLHLKEIAESLDFFKVYKLNNLIYHKLDKKQL